jgi:ABC-type lipoprotein export system ATPase subunit
MDIRDRVYAILKELSHKLDISIIAVTHDPLMKGIADVNIAVRKVDGRSITDVYTTE